MKTQAMRILDSNQIGYEVRSYPEDEKDAVRIAHLLELDPLIVFKTLVIVRAQSKPLLVMIPSSNRVDLKKVAKAAGEKKVKMASHNQAEELTGLQVGGISPISLINKGFIPYIDQQADGNEKLFVSAGKRGLQIGLHPEDLRRIIKGTVIDAVLDE